MPRLTLDDLRKQRVSEDVRRLNPGLFPASRMGSVDTAVHGKSKRALDGKTQAKRGSRVRTANGVEIVITLTAHIGWRTDSDNLANACKPLRDAIAEELGIDDGDDCLRWEYGQVETRGTCGVVVKIEFLKVKHL